MQCRTPHIAAAHRRILPGGRDELAKAPLHATGANAAPVRWRSAQSGVARYSRDPHSEPSSPAKLPDRCKPGEEATMGHALRPLTQADTEALIAFHERCSARTHYLRFFSPKPRLRPHEAAYFCDTDQCKRGAYAVIDPDDPQTIHGVGRWTAVSDDSAHIAFVIEDGYQGHGLGKHLFRTVLAAARAQGFTKLIGDVLSENGAMRHLLRTAGYPLHESHAGYGDVEFALHLSAAV